MTRPIQVTLKSLVIYFIKKKSIINKNGRNMVIVEQPLQTPPQAALQAKFRFCISSREVSGYELK